MQKKKTKQNIHTQKNKETKQRKKKERLKSNFPSLHCYHWPFSNWRRIIHLQSPSKLTVKQMEKVRGIIHPKFRPFHFQIKTCYLSAANYPMDNPSQTDNPSLVCIRPFWYQDIFCTKDKSRLSVQPFNHDM